MIACKGPTNTRVYTVAVYFRGQRLAKADGPSIQAAEMNAAKYALQDCSHLFPHLQHQRRIMERSFMNQGIIMKKIVWEEEVRTKRRQMGLDEIHNECSKRNDEKIKKHIELLEQKKLQKKTERGNCHVKEARESESCSSVNHASKHQHVIHKEVDNSSLGTEQGSLQSSQGNEGSKFGEQPDNSLKDRCQTTFARQSPGSLAKRVLQGQTKSKLPKLKPTKQGSNKPSKPSSEHKEEGELTDDEFQTDNEAEKQASVSTDNSNSVDASNKDVGITDIEQIKSDFVDDMVESISSPE